MYFAVEKEKKKKKKKKKKKLTGPIRFLLTRSNRASV
jgi:hypothetical protein